MRFFGRFPAVIVDVQIISASIILFTLITSSSRFNNGSIFFLSKYLISSFDTREGVCSIKKEMAELKERKERTFFSATVFVGELIKS